MAETDERQHHVDWLKTFAGALAAVSSALLLSTLGAAGTIIGAALGSVIVSVTSTLYSQGLARSRARMADAQVMARRRVGVAQAEVRRAQRVSGPDAVDAHLEHADQELAEARAGLDAAEHEIEDPAPVGWRERLVVLPWRRVALVAGTFFVIAVVAITGFELIAGRPVSSYTGGSSDNGTSWSHLDGGHKKAPRTPTQTPSPSESPSANTSPSATPTASTSPTPTPSSEPSATSTGSATAAPTDQPTSTAPADTTPAPGAIAQ
jgi:hypothetical protein